MNHQDTQDAFLDYVDGRLAESAAADLEGHLSTCASCAQALTEYRQVFARLHELRDTEYSPARGFAEEIMEQLSHDVMSEVDERQPEAPPANLGKKERFFSPVMKEAIALGLLCSLAVPIGVLFFSSLALPSDGASANIVAFISGGAGALTFVGLAVVATLAAISRVFRTDRPGITATTAGLIAAAIGLLLFRTAVAGFFSSDSADSTPGGDADTIFFVLLTLFVDASILLLQRALQKGTQRALVKELRRFLLLSLAGIALGFALLAVLEGGGSGSMPAALLPALKISVILFTMVAGVLLVSLIALLPQPNPRYHFRVSGGLAFICVGMFALRGFVSLFYGTDYDDYVGSSHDSVFQAAASKPVYRDRIFSKAAAPSSQPDSVATLARTSPAAGERYAVTTPHGWTSVSQQPVSTFAADIDTGSYTNIRRFIREHRFPPPEAVRVEELVNYFQYQYPEPKEAPFSVSLEAAPSPLDAGRQLLRIGIKTKSLPPRNDRGWNLVFLIDVSGSMGEPEKLPLLKESLRVLTSHLRAEDRVSIVTYSDTSTVILPSTSGANSDRILGTIDGLVAGGGTNGGQGIQTAYDIAKTSFIPGGVNRVILATDGDFNVGISSFSDLIDFIKEEKKTGVSLTTLGMGKGDLRENLLEQLADQGSGNYFYIDSLDEARRIFERRLASTMEIVAKDVKLQLELNPAQVEAYRQIGFENRELGERDFTNDRVSGGQLGSGHTVTALYEVRYAPGMKESDTRDGGAKEDNGARGKADELGFLKIRYKDPNASPSDPAVEMSVPIVKKDVLRSGDPSEDFRFAAAVAAFGELLHTGLHMPTSGADQQPTETDSSNAKTLDSIAQVASRSSSFDPDAERREFIDLVQDVRSFLPQPPPPHRYEQSSPSAR